MDPDEGRIIPLRSPNRKTTASHKDLRKPPSLSSHRQLMLALQPSPQTLTIRYGLSLPNNQKRRVTQFRRADFHVKAQLGGNMYDQKQRIEGAEYRQRHGLRFGVARVYLAGLAIFLASAVSFGAPPANSSPEATQGTASSAARKFAVQSIPFDKLSADAREKVNSVLSSVSIYRRLPVRMVNCDPDMYLFLVRHPDVVVNIWEILGVAQLQLRQTDIDTFRIVEAEGMSATLEYVYHGHDLQILHGKWTYTGPLLARKITGSCLAVLKTAYSRDTSGKYYVTSRMDGFLSVDSGGAEMLARALQPLVVKNVDNNFIQTVAFLGSMSKTAEVNLPGMQRLAGRLTHVQPETRQQLSDVVASVSHRAALNSPGKKEEPRPRVASRPQDEEPRQ
jgi:hypothetical protein